MLFGCGLRLQLQGKDMSTKLRIDSHWSYSKQTSAVAMKVWRKRVKDESVIRAEDPNSILLALST